MTGAPPPVDPESPPAGGLSGVTEAPKRSFPARLLETLDRANIPLLASALTFDALLALIPLLILVIAGLGALLQWFTVEGDTSVIFARLLPPHAHGTPTDSFALVEALLEKVRVFRSSLTWVAIPAFLWFSTRMFGAVRVCLSAIFQVRQRAAPGGYVVSYLLGYVRAKAGDLLMVGVVLGLILVNTVLSAALALLDAEGVVALRPPWTFLVSGLGQLLGTALAFAFGLALFVALYRFASPKRLAWSGALLAGSVATIGFEIAKRLYGWYLTTVSTTGRLTLDANIGAGVLVVLWLWYMALVFLLGAAVADTWDRGRKR